MDQVLGLGVVVPDLGVATGRCKGDLTAFRGSIYSSEDVSGSSSSDSIFLTISSPPVAP